MADRTDGKESNMGHESLLVDRSRPGLASLTLNRPAKLNAPSHDMLLALDEAITEPNTMQRSRLRPLPRRRELPRPK
jgi:hypothetical protein